MSCHSIYQNRVKILFKTVDTEEVRLAKAIRGTVRRVRSLRGDSLVPGELLTATPSESFTHFHEDATEFVRAQAVSAIAPIGIVLGVLNDLGIVC